MQGHLSPGAHLGLRELKFHLCPRLQRVLFYSFKSYNQPTIRKNNFPQMLHSGSVRTTFLTFFQKSLFSPRTSPPVLCHLSSFFICLILNAGIKEASKSWREADVWWGNAGGTRPISPQTIPPLSSQRVSMLLWENMVSGLTIQHVAILNK